MNILHEALLRPLSRRLDLRIVTLFLLLLLGVQAACFVALRHSIDRNARAQIAHELQTGENVLRRLLVQNAGNLREAARLLAADFGFRDAIASGDRATLVDALDNQAARIGASVALFADPQFRLVASTIAGADPVLALARSGGGPAAAADTMVRVLEGQPFQLVSVPVKAPQLIGHVAMGFPISDQLPADLRQISMLKTGLMRRAAGGPWEMLPIGDEAAQLAAIAPQLGTGAPERGVRLADEDYGVRIVPLGRGTTHEVAAVLLRSVDEVVAPYRQLQLVLLAITLVGVAVFGAGSVATARRITRPIKALSASARRLGAGDHATPVHVDSDDEVKELAQAFEAMRHGLAEREAQISRLAYWDGLTGLPNRAQFRTVLGDALVRSRAAGAPCAVLMLDLDRFKHVNDVLGHAFGDRLLRCIAERLAGSLVREEDVVARLSSDEFAVCLPMTGRDDALAVAARLRHALELPLAIDDQTIDVSAGIGIAAFPRDGEEADTLIGRAEVAMYAAKSRQAGVTAYEPGVDTASQESLSLLTELRTALEEEQLRLFLQPKIALASGRVLGAEALVRWQHPERGMIAPMRFIPFAEQTGFIRALTGWMIERCAARGRQLQSAGHAFKFAINLSTRDLVDQDLPAKLERLLLRDGMDPRMLCMEITESAIMDDPQRALQTLARLHGMGLQLAIDDFGTGYSSLAYLKRLPLHELKIDKSFVMAMERDDADLKIVRSTIDLAHNLGLTVVAEGVENLATWSLLRDLRCDEAQGYFMARPMPEAEFAGWAAAWAPPQAAERAPALA